MEVYVQHCGLVGKAAALVCADAAVCRPVLLNAATARQRELLRFTGLELRSAGFPSWHLCMKERITRKILSFLMIWGSKIELWKSSASLGNLL